MPSSTALLEPDEIGNLTGVARFVRDEIVRAIASFSEVDRAVICGSRARGDFWHHSDIDVALFGERATWETAARIKDALDNSFIVFPIDVTAVATLARDSSIRGAIDRDGIVIYDRVNPPSAATSR